MMAEKNLTIPVEVLKVLESGSWLSRKPLVYNVSHWSRYSKISTHWTCYNIFMSAHPLDQILVYICNEVLLQHWEIVVVGGLLCHRLVVVATQPCNVVPFLFLRHHLQHTASFDFFKSRGLSKEKYFWPKTFKKYKTLTSRLSTFNDYKLALFEECCLWSTRQCNCRLQLRCQWRRWSLCRRDEPTLATTFARAGPPPPSSSARRPTTATARARVLGNPDTRTLWKRRQQWGRPRRRPASTSSRRHKVGWDQSQPPKRAFSRWCTCAMVVGLVPIIRLSDFK